MTDEIPFIAIGTEELERQPKLKHGDTIVCPNCKQEHVVEAQTGTRREGDAWVKGSFELLFFRCGESTYLAGINGKKLPT